MVDEQRLAQLALTATASQLARMISGFRSADGRRMSQQTKRAVSWHEREDGMIDFHDRLPKEEAAVLIAAIDTARDQFGPPPKPDPCGDDEQQPAPGVGSYSKADASRQPGQPGRRRSRRNVATGVGGLQHCRRRGIEAATAQKLACDSSVLDAVVDKHGKVLALGRTRRLVTKALRRALMIRDGMCQFPGCHSTRHLKAHHRVRWIKGGRTDLDNLILLCQWHHTAVHERGVTISGDGDGWLFTRPDGQPCQPWVDDQNLARHLDFALRWQRQQAQHDQLAAVDSFQHPDAQTIRPRWAGETFDLHACVQALLTIKLREPIPDLDQQVA